MWFGIVLFVTSTVSFKLAESLSSTDRFDVQQERRMTGNLTSMTVIPARSRIECTVKCLENADCCMSSYNRDTNTCTIDLSGCCDAITGQADDTDIMIKLSAIRTFQSNHSSFGEKPKDCTDISNQCNACTSSIYTIFPVGSCGLDVLCMMKTNGYSWTVLLRRINGLTNFYRNWKQYKKGFGSVFGEYWIGNENLYLLTKQKNYQLLIEMEDFSGNKPYAFYNTFSVGSENEKYKLSIGGYYGIAGDSMINHNGMNFATFDNDTYIGPMCGGCPVGFSGGYWYNCCYQNHLTGPIVEGGGGMAWLTWTGYKSLKTARMMIRPRN